MKTILTNGAELAPIIVMGERRYAHGASRDALTFVFPASEEITALDALFVAENCESVTIETNEGEIYVHKDYAVRVELVKKPVQIVEPTEETEAVYEDRIFVTMAQRTEQEKLTAEMSEAIELILSGVTE